MNSKPLSRCLLLLLTLSFAGRTSAQSPTAPIEPTILQAPPSHPPVKLQFRLQWGYLAIVEGSIGDIHGLNFLVDTGSHPSIVDQKIARSLRLTGEPVRVSLSGTSVPTQRVVLPSLLVGPIRAESLPALAQDLSFFEKAIGIQVDAIVGLDVLRKSSFTINYQTNEIIFGPVERLPYSAPFETDTPVVTIRVQALDQQLRLVVDTGGPDLMLLQSRLRGFPALERLGVEKVADVSGSFHRRRVLVPDVHLGKEKIGSQIAFILDDRKDDGDDFDGVLGVRGAKFRKIAFDFEHHTFSWDR
jgi:hypothetical protein